MAAMLIYFAGSISGGRDDVSIYQKIVHLLKSYGEVLTEHVVDNPQLDSSGNN